MYGRKTSLMIIAEERGEYDAKDHRLEMDRMLKKLFKSSRQGTLDLVKGLFLMTFDKDVQIEILDAEHVRDDLSSSIADIFIKIVDRKGSTIVYLEFETIYRSTIVLRMKRYSYEKAVQEMQLTHKGPLKSPLLIYPISLLLLLEENTKAPPYLSMYTCKPFFGLSGFYVPVFKLWTYTPRRLYEEGLYMLLPLKVFNFRRDLSRLDNRIVSDRKKQPLWKEIHNSIKEQIQEITEWIFMALDKGKIDEEITGLLLDLMNLITTILYKRYKNLDIYRWEVIEMVTSLYDPVLVKELEKRIEKEITKKVEKEITKEVTKKVEKGARDTIRDIILILLSDKVDYHQYSRSVEEELWKEEKLINLKNWIIKATKAKNTKDFLMDLNGGS